MADIEQRLREQEEWTIEHDATIKQLWKQQAQLNIKNSTKFDAIFNKIGCIERKMIWFAGVAAGIGAILGSGLFTFINRGGA